MRYTLAVIERFYARAHPKRPNRQQVNIYQWLEAVVLNLFSTGRTMVQVQESRACY